MCLVQVLSKKLLVHLSSYQDGMKGKRHVEGLSHIDERYIAIIS